VMGCLMPLPMPSRRLAARAGLLRRRRRSVRRRCLIAAAVVLPPHTQGFGPEGLGIVTVSGVPEYEELRQQLLPLAQAFAVRSSAVGPRQLCYRAAAATMHSRTHASPPFPTHTQPTGPAR
jgi:hypothetical protein